MSRMYILWALRFKMHVLRVGEGVVRRRRQLARRILAELVVWQRGCSGFGPWSASECEALVGQEGRGCVRSGKKLCFLPPSP